MDVAVVIAIGGVVSTVITATASIVVALIQSRRIDRKVEETVTLEENHPEVAKQVQIETDREEEKNDR